MRLQKRNMDIIRKFMFANDSVLVTVMSTKTLVNKAIALHDLSPTAAAALGRTLTATSFMASKLKGKDEKLSVTVNGGGGLGKIVAAGDAGEKVRGYVDNPRFDLPLKNGKLDVGGAVGKNGYLTVIKDLGLKEPYIGKTELVEGEIANDFAYYFTVSEQQPSAVALGVLVNNTGCIASGGIFVQPMPGCPDYVITMLEDIVSEFKNVSKIFLEKTVDEIIKEYFGQFELHFLDIGKPEYKCHCSRSKLKKIIISLGKEEAESILSEKGEIEICCQFCNKKYVFTREEVSKIFGN